MRAKRTTQARATGTELPAAYTSARCLNGHPIPKRTSPCGICRAMIQTAEDDAFEAACRNPPAELVMRDHSGAVTSVLKLPRGIKRRPLARGRGRR